MSILTATLMHDVAVSEMTTQEFLGLLRQRQIEVRVHEGRLKVSAPAGAIDASLEAELRGRKAMLLEALGKPACELEANSPLVPLSGAALSGRIPLTAAQQGIWLIDHFNPGNVAYNIPEAFRFEDAIELETVQAAVDQLIARHAILRTSFSEEDGELSQSIAAAVEARVGFTDLSSLPEEESERRCRELIRSEGRRAFDLNKAPLIRFHLFRIAPKRHVAFINVHHIIADRTAMYVLRGELAALSRAVLEGREAVLPALSMQFAEYAVWAAKQMQGKAMDEQLAYWKNKFAGLPKPIELPHSRPRPEKRSSAGATKLVFVDAAARLALNRIGTEESASPFMTFLALFAVSVGLWSQATQPGTADFCIGSPITQRKDAATERMIGLFVNMLAFRCVIEPGMSFREVLKQVRRTALEAYENSDVPFQRLVTALNPDRRSQRSPFFQVMFGYETYLPPVANEFPMDAEQGSARYDLSLNLSETASDGLTGMVEYCTDLFEEADIERLVTLGGALAAAILRDPDRDIFDLGTVTEISGVKAGPVDDIEGDACDSLVYPKPDAKAAAKSGLFRGMARLFSSL